MTLVVSLKNILVDDEPEKHDGLLQDSLDFVVRFLERASALTACRE
jgi:hypothetical protein